jgi:enterochelin esterase-like enzyme
MTFSSWVFYQELDSSSEGQTSSRCFALLAATFSAALLDFGLKHLDAFTWIGGLSSAWIGGFSSAPNTKPAADLITDPDEVSKKLRLLWVSCGDKDHLLGISDRFHTALGEKKIPHIWHIDSGRHEWPVWKNDLYLFSQMLFRDGIRSGG